MKSYRSAAKAAAAEYEVQKSRFIAHVRPVETREEAERFFAEIRKKYRDATHNVPALVLGEQFQVQWASDDGEPQGTSGAPMVQLLVSEKITNVAVIVTRYFGGIKLGTGGLVRAYTSALKEGLKAAGLVEIRQMHEVRARFDYSCLARIQNQASRGLYDIEEIVYEDAVIITLICSPEDREAMHLCMADMSQGKYEILSENTCEKKVKITEKSP